MLAIGLPLLYSYTSSGHFKLQNATSEITGYFATEGQNFKIKGVVSGGSKLAEGTNFKARIVIGQPAAGIAQGTNFKIYLGFNPIQALAPVACTLGENRSCGTDEGECTAGNQTCQDDGTWGTECAGEIGPSNEICDDTLDNDCDGAVDCADGNCTAYPTCIAAACTDTDGGVNYTVQGNCTNASGSITELCSMDGRLQEYKCRADNSCELINYNCSEEGKICDTGACVAPPSAAETICDDGIDNDNDNATDCADENCNNMPCNSNCAKSFCVLGSCGPEICDNSEDENCNGLIDMQEPGCCQKILEGDYESQETNCSDEIDNDCDGDADCLDSDCTLDVACIGLDPPEADFTITGGIDFDAGTKENTTVVNDALQLAINPATGTHYTSGTWESVLQTMLAGSKLSKLVIFYHDVSGFAYLDEIKVNVDGETSARYSTDIISGSSIELANDNLTYGSFDDVTDDFTVAVDLVGGSTPVIDSIVGYYATIPPDQQPVLQNIVSGSRGGSGGHNLDYMLGEPRDYCGDGNCSATESKTMCCVDCGCPTGQICRWAWCYSSQATPISLCGNNKVNGNEECDGRADSNCRGLCGSDCTCAYKTGDGICQSAHGESPENSPNDCYVAPQENVIPQKKANNLYFGIMLFALLAGVGGGGYWWFVQRPKEELGGLAEEHGVHIPENSTSGQIQDFVNACRQQGYSDMQIKILLSRYGWAEQDISKVLGA